MDKEIDNDVLSYFADDLDDDAADSADELLDMLTNSNEASKKNTSSGENLCSDNDNEDDEDTTAQIAALQAQIELLKSKKSPPAAKGKTEVKNGKVHDDNNISCKHGKPVIQCFFCSSAASTETPVVKKPEVKSPEVVKKRKEEQKSGKKQCEDAPIDRYPVLPTIDGVSTTEFSKKRRFAHEDKANTGNENPGKKVKVAKEKGKENSARNSHPLHQKDNPRDKGNAHVFAGIEINKPVLSSTVFEERTKGRKLVKMSKIETSIKGRDIEGDWVTVGVVVQKVVQKKSSSGKNFCVWKLSDLSAGTENNLVAFFLFGECYNHHWKIQIGRVITLLNPEIMKQDDKFSGREIAIKIDNPKKLMEIGDAKYLGGCKGTRRSDGRGCTMFVNKKLGEYCEYHVHAAFKKAKSGRMDLQSGGRTPRNKGNILNNLRKDISGGEYHYGGKTVTLHEEKHISKPRVKNDILEKGLKKFMGQQIRMQASLEFNEAKLKREEEAKLTKKDATASSFLKNNRNDLLKVSTVKKDLVSKSCAEGTKNMSEKVTGTSSMKLSRNNIDFVIKKDKVIGQSHGDEKVKQCDINFFDASVTDKDENISPKRKNSSDDNKMSVEGRKISPNLKSSLNERSTVEEKKISPKQKNSLEEKSTVEGKGIPRKQKNSLGEKSMVEGKNISPKSKNSLDKKLGTMEKNKSPNLKSSCKSNPVLGRGLKSNDFLEFSPVDDDFCYYKHTGEDLLTPNPTILKRYLPKNLEQDKKEMHVPVRAIQAKRSAISIVQARGPIELEDQNIDIPKEKTPKSLKNVEKMIGKCEVSHGETKQKKKSLLAGVLGHIDLNSEDGKKLLEKKSKHIGVVKLAEAEREDQYFDSLEKKENMQEKMASIFEMKVSGIACRECRYLAESQSQLCRDLNHAVAKIPNMIKRFFICKSCKQRCYSYNKLLPTKACTRCGENHFEKTSMAMERKGPLLGAETLELRGPEKKFINSMY